MDLLKRMYATQATVDQFKEKAFDWGTYDCGQLVVAHAANCGRKIVVPPYGDKVGAARSLREAGWGTLHNAMDVLFTPIEPASAIMGDFVELPGGDGFSCLTVAVGNGRVLGFHADIPHCDILQPVLISGAWSIV